MSRLRWMLRSLSTLPVSISDGILINLYFYLERRLLSASDRLFCHVKCRMDIRASRRRQSRLHGSCQRGRISSNRDHLKPLVREFPSLISRRSIDPRGLLVLLGHSLDLRNSLLELIVHRSVQNRVADVIAQIERPAKQHIDPRDSGYLFNLSLRQFCGVTMQCWSAKTFFNAS